MTMALSLFFCTKWSFPLLHSWGCKLLFWANILENFLQIQIHLNLLKNNRMSCFFWGFCCVASRWISFWLISDRHTRDYIYISYRCICTNKNKSSNLTCGFSSIRLTPSTRWERNLARSALLNRDLLTEAICTKQDNTWRRARPKENRCKKRPHGDFLFMILSPPTTSFFTHAPNSVLSAPAIMTMTEKDQGGHSLGHLKPLYWEKKESITFKLIATTS